MAPPRKAIAVSALALIVVMVSACATGGSHPSQADARPPFIFEQQSLQSRFEYQAGSHISVRNDWGDIHVRQAPGSAFLSVDANIQRIGDEPPPPPGIELVETPGRVRLHVEFDGASLQPRTGRVDLVVWLPDRVTAQFEALDGVIDAKKISGPLSASTDSGDIRLSGNGPLRARSESGSILAFPIRPGWGDATLRSTSGAITAFLPESAHLRLSVSGTESVTSHWPLSANGKALEHTSDAGRNGRDRVVIETTGAVAVHDVVMRPEEAERSSP